MRFASKPIPTGQRNDHPPLRHPLHGLEHGDGGWKRQYDPADDGRGHYVGAPGQRYDELSKWSVSCRCNHGDGRGGWRHDTPPPAASSGRAIFEGGNVQETLDLVWILDLPADGGGNAPGEKDHDRTGRQRQAGGRTNSRSFHPPAERMVPAGGDPGTFPRLRIATPPPNHRQKS